MSLLETCNDKDAKRHKLFVPLLPVLPKVEGTFVPVGTRGNYPWFSYLTGNYPLGSGKDFRFSGGTTTRR